MSLEEGRRQSSRRVPATAVGSVGSVRPKRVPFAEEYPPGTKAVVRRGNSVTPVMVDFVKMEMASLIRYKIFYNLDAPPNATKRELMQVVMRHFSQHPRLRDAEVISAFLYANQRYKKSLGRLQIN